MSSNTFQSNIESYQLLTAESVLLLSELCQEKTVAKNRHLLKNGSIPKYHYYVEKGFFAYYYINDQGEKIIKNFFPENTFMASTSALLTKTTSNFAIQALEDSVVFKIPAERFTQLVSERHDIALFYIKYLERKWVIEKEMLEIFSKSDEAKVRYDAFLMSYTDLIPRLKQHHIASYLGITPTQLSRIKLK